MITGSCLCGSVSWQVDGALEHMTHCHCSMCRKAHAAPFATYVNAARDSFRWLSDDDAVNHYESSPGAIRAFCSTCGSVLPESRDKERIAMPASCLDEDPGVRPTAHIFAPSKALWHTIGDNLQQYENYPQPDDGPVVERTGHGKGEVGVLRNSCLCGDIAYEVRTPIESVHNCHYSRCRKARAPAHATNGFTAIDGVVFVRGENKLKTYKLPSARSPSGSTMFRTGEHISGLERSRRLSC